ncbi:MAG: hypothetical protein IJS73_06245 [Paludibacteraceae bacterium]|nr:hypothetical protein [Paludibacteraceae bacterium]
MADYKPEIEYTEKGWRIKTDPNRHHRENNWDYSGRAIYHFTLVVAERYPLFGKLIANTPKDAYIELNEYGLQVKNILKGLTQFYQPKGYELKILATKIMPDHIHLVLQVLEPLPRSIGTVIRGFKAACTKVYKERYVDNGGENATEMHEELNKQLNQSQNKSQSDQSIVHFARIFAGKGSVWQTDPAHYHERILHSDGQLRRMIDYVNDNPRRLALKRANPQLFKLHQPVKVAGFECTTLGNQFLLDFPMKSEIQCSRRLTQTEIAEKYRKCLAEAERGTVFVSASISEGEKHICRALRETGFPLIILLKDGFPAEDSVYYKYFKPQGIYFEACAKGQLLLIEPNKDFYENKTIEKAVYDKTGNLPHDTMRYKFIALNTLAKLISQN